MGLFSKLFGNSNAIDRAKAKHDRGSDENAYFDWRTEEIVGGFSDTARGNLIERQTGNYGEQHYYVDDDGQMFFINHDWRDRENKVTDAGCNVFYDWRQRKHFQVDLDTGQIVGEYKPR